MLRFLRIWWELGWKVHWRQIAAMVHRIEALEERVSTLESLLTPEQVAQLDLIRKCEHVVAVAVAEGQLKEPPL